MSYPLHDLKARLSTRKPLLGKVVRREGTTLICATPEGRREALSGPNVKVGDRVVIREGVAYRSPRVLVSIPV